MADKVREIQLKLTGDAAGLSSTLKKADKELGQIARNRGAETIPIAKRSQFEVLSHLEGIGKSLKGPEISALEEGVADAMRKVAVVAAPEAQKAGAKLSDEIEDGLFKRLKSSNKTVRTFTHLFLGGGALGGIGFAAAQLRDAFNEANKLRDAFDAGAISAGEMNEKLIETVPVFGQIRQAGLAIREFFTGEEEASRQITLEAERTVKLIDLQNEARRAAIAADTEHLDVIRQIHNEMELLGLSGGSKESRGIGQKFEDFAIERSRKAQEDADKAATPESATGKALAQAVENRKAAQTALDKSTDYFAQAAARNPDQDYTKRERANLERAVNTEKKVQQAAADAATAIWDRANEEISEKSVLTVQERAKALLESAGQTAGEFVRKFLAAGEEAKKELAEKGKSDQKTSDELRAAHFAGLNVRSDRIPETVNPVQSRLIAGVDQLPVKLDRQPNAVQTVDYLRRILRQLQDSSNNSGFTLSPF